MKNFTSYFSYKSLHTLYSGLLIGFLPFFYSPIELGYYSITIIIQSLAGLLTVGIPIRLNKLVLEKDNFSNRFNGLVLISISIYILLSIFFFSFIDSGFSSFLNNNFPDYHLILLLIFLGIFKNLIYLISQVLFASKFINFNNYYLSISNCIKIIFVTINFLFINLSFVNLILSLFLLVIFDSIILITYFMLNNKNYYFKSKPVFCIDKTMTYLIIIGVLALIYGNIDKYLALSFMDEKTYPVYTFISLIFIPLQTVFYSLNEYFYNNITHKNQNFEKKYFIKKYYIIMIIFFIFIYLIFSLLFYLFSDLIKITLSIFNLADLNIFVLVNIIFLTNILLALSGILLSILTAINEYKIIIMSISNSLIIYLLIFLLLLFIFEVSFEYTLIFSFFSFSIAYAVILFYKFINLKF